MHLYLSFRHGSGRTLEVNIEASCLAVHSLSWVLISSEENAAGMP